MSRAAPPTDLRGSPAISNRPYSNGFRIGRRVCGTVRHTIPRTRDGYTRRRHAERRGGLEPLMSRVLFGQIGSDHSGASHTRVGTPGPEAPRGRGPDRARRCERPRRPGESRDGHVGNSHRATAGPRENPQHCRGSTPRGIRPRIEATSGGRTETDEGPQHHHHRRSAPREVRTRGWKRHRADAPK